MQGSSYRGFPKARAEGGNTDGVAQRADGETCKSACISHGGGYIARHRSRPDIRSVVRPLLCESCMSWRLFNTLSTHFCLEALDEALALYGRPEIFIADQGCQFTSEYFAEHLKGCGIAISMDGKGR